MSARQRLTRIMGQMGPSKPRGSSKANAPDPKRKWHILRGDKVQIIGKDHVEKGKQGIVQKVLRPQNRVIIEGLHLVPKQIKGNPDRGIQARTILKERSIAVQDVNLVDPVTGKPTRITRKYLDNGEKVRVAVGSGAIIPRPEILKYRKRPVRSTVTSSDTLEEDVWAVTYEYFDANGNPNANTNANAAST